MLKVKFLHSESSSSKSAKVLTSKHSWSTESKSTSYADLDSDAELVMH